MFISLLLKKKEKRKVVKKSPVESIERKCAI
jgi:hypothetical protein